MCGPRGLTPAERTFCTTIAATAPFEDVTTKDHTSTRRMAIIPFSVSTLDYDDDGWPDIFVACDGAASILYHNNRDGTFTDVAVTAGAAFNEDGRSQAGMGSTVADYDGDGRLDIFKTNFSDDTSTLLHNDKAGTLHTQAYARVSFDSYCRLHCSDPAAATAHDGARAPAFSRTVLIRMPDFQTVVSV